jgi:hypothetical protein
MHTVPAGLPVVPTPYPPLTECFPRPCGSRRSAPQAAAVRSSPPPSGASTAAPPLAARTWRRLGGTRTARRQVTLPATSVPVASAKPPPSPGISPLPFSTLFPLTRQRRWRRASPFQSAAHGPEPVSPLLHHHAGDLQLAFLRHASGRIAGPGGLAPGLLVKPVQAAASSAGREAPPPSGRAGTDPLQEPVRPFARRARPVVRTSHRPAATAPPSVHPPDRLG